MIRLISALVRVAATRLGIGLAWIIDIVMTPVSHVMRQVTLHLAKGLLYLTGGVLWIAEAVCDIASARWLERSANSSLPMAYIQLLILMLGRGIYYVARFFSRMAKAVVRLAG